MNFMRSFPAHLVLTNFLKNLALLGDIFFHFSKYYNEKHVLINNRIDLRSN